MERESIEALVIGGGPAGLMAAEALAAAGRAVVVAEAKPTVGRKLLMAGKSGLNLTMDAPPEAFAAAYHEGGDWLAPILAGFGPAEVRRVGRGARGRGLHRQLGAGVPAGDEGLAAAARLAAAAGGRRGRLPDPLALDRLADGAAALRDARRARARSAPGATVLALGGASWARLGSDGAWAPVLAAEGVAVAPFRPSNVGFAVAWSPAMARHFGAPVKPVRLSAGGVSVTAEFVVSARGRRRRRHLRARPPPARRRAARRST